MNNIIKFLLLILLISTISACAKKSLYTEVHTKHLPKSLEYTIKHINLNNTENDTIVFKHFSLYHNNDTSYLLVLNNYLQQLQIYNLTTQNIQSSRKLADLDIFKNPDYGEINSIYFHNFDSIFVAQEYRISIINYQETIYSKPINDLKNNKLPQNYYANLDHAPIYFDQALKGVVTQNYCAACGFSDIKYYKSSIESLISIESDQIINFPIQYPTLYTNNYYGFANHIFRTVKDSLSIFSFPIDPNIYIYNRREDSLRIIGGKSRYQLNAAIPLSRKLKKDSNKKLEHLASVPFYHQILYDPFRKLYYRFFSKELNIKNDDGTYNNWGDKEIVLMVFNENFDLLDEIDLGKHKYGIFHSFVSKEGLFISTSHYKNPNYNKFKAMFDVYTFE